MKNILFVKYNALRCPSFQITTRIYENNGERFVEKVPNSPMAWKHVEDFAANCYLLRKAHKNVEAAEPVIEAHATTYEYISGKTLEEELQDAFHDINSLIREIQKKLKYIYEYKEGYTEIFRYTEKFAEIFCRSMSEEEKKNTWELLKDCDATTAADIDLVFDNIIKKQGKYILLDYEWVFRFPVPIAFLKFRTAAYFYDRHNLYFSGKCSRSEFFEKLGFDETAVNCFDKMEAGFQEFVRGDYHYLSAYQKKIIPFRAYETYAEELQRRDDSIRFLNEVIDSKEEYIASLEQLIHKYHSNPAYKLMNSVRRFFK